MVKMLLSAFSDMNPLHREVHPEDVFNADICTKHVQLTLQKE